MTLSKFLAVLITPQIVMEFQKLSALILRVLILSLMKLGLFCKFPDLWV
jgi:hypothetical protein